LCWARKCRRHGRARRQSADQAAPEQPSHQLFNIPYFDRPFFDGSPAVWTGFLSWSKMLLLGFAREPGYKAIVARNMAARGQCVRFVQKIEADLAGERLIELG
jgi:hypothetical protein